MKFPKRKGFELHCGLVITAVLDNGFSLTGTFLGEIEERHHDPIICPPSPVNVHVDNDSEFIFLQLKCPFCAPDLPYIPEETIVAVNVAQILFIFLGGECEIKKDS